MSINSQNFALATKWLTAGIAPQTVASASTVNGSSVTITGTNGNEIAFVVIVGSVGGGTVTAKLQYSDNGSTGWTDAGYSVTLSAAGVVPLSVGRALFGHDYARIVITTTGTNATVAAAYTAYQLTQAPDPSLVAGTDYVAAGN